MFSEFPLSQAFVGVVAYKTLGSPGMGYVIGEESAFPRSGRNRRPNAQALQRLTRRKKSEKVRLPTSGCLQPGTRFCLSAEPDNRAIDRSRKGRSSSETQTPREVLVGPGPECRNPGANLGTYPDRCTILLWLQTLDVCPIVPEQPRRLRSAPGRIRYPVQGASIRESTGWSSLAETLRERRNDGSRESSCRSRSYPKMAILRY
jgi:hypothetical protein